MPAALLPLAAAAALAAADTTRYVVLNHDRPAGEMVVVRRGDSVTVRYVFVDRNRGTRLEHRYRVLRDGRVVGAESRPLDPEGRPGEPTDRFELVADSVRRSARGRDTVTRADPGTYQGISGTPFDQALLARYLLSSFMTPETQQELAQQYAQAAITDEWKTIVALIRDVVPRLEEVVEVAKLIEHEPAADAEPAPTDVEEGDR